MDSTLKLVQWLVVAATLVIAMFGGTAKGVALCNTDTTELSLCLPAATGSNPPPPTAACCAVARRADLPCLCKYISFLPSYGIDPNKALAVPGKCGLKTPNC